jgi:hypothetical protein
LPQLPANPHAILGGQDKVEEENLRPELPHLRDGASAVSHPFHEVAGSL